MDAYKHLGDAYTILCKAKQCVLNFAKNKNISVTFDNFEELFVEDSHRDTQSSSELFCPFVEFLLLNEIDNSESELFCCNFAFKPRTFSQGNDKFKDLRKSLIYGNFKETCATCHMRQAH